MKIALDADRYSDLVFGDESLADLIENADAVFMPFVVVGELRAGFSAGRRATDNERLLRRFLLKPGVEIRSGDEQTTHHYASVYAQLRRQGTPIPTNDMWIAALVLQYDLILCSRDGHFDRLMQIPRA